MSLFLLTISNPWIYYILAIIIGYFFFKKSFYIVQRNFFKKLLYISTFFMVGLYWLSFLFLLNLVNAELEYIILISPFFIYLILSVFKKYIGAEGGKLIILVGQI